MKDIYTNFYNSPYLPHFPRMTNLGQDCGSVRYWLTAD